MIIKIITSCNLLENQIVPLSLSICSTIYKKTNYWQRQSIVIKIKHFSALFPNIKWIDSHLHIKRVRPRLHCFRRALRSQWSAESFAGGFLDSILFFDENYNLKPYNINTTRSICCPRLTSGIIPTNVI